ncbi:MAG: hypothetical protein U5R48_00790 [Gammaproteobacteria bacterium]|nr:hypothetical protein [Gammaproteobacteria bacterium]
MDWTILTIGSGGLFNITNANVANSGSDTRSTTGYLFTSPTHLVRRGSSRPCIRACPARRRWTGTPTSTATTTEAWRGRNHVSNWIRPTTRRRATGPRGADWIPYNDPVHPRGRGATAPDESV